MSPLGCRSRGSWLIVRVAVNRQYARTDFSSSSSRSNRLSLKKMASSMVARKSRGQEELRINSIREGFDNKESNSWPIFVLCVMAACYENEINLDTVIIQDPEPVEIPTETSEEPVLANPIPIEGATVQAPA